MIKKLLFIFLLFTVNVSMATTYYVKTTSSGSGNGSSWSNASGDLQAILDIAVTGDEIWVAGGTYLPTESPDGTTSNTRNQAFHFNQDIKVYGGFAGTETNISQRVSGNASILSGNIGVGNSNIDNSYHVLVIENVTNAATFDGFTIQNGNANEGGLGQDITYGTSVFSPSSGGGIAISKSGAIIKNCIINDNDAISGGGMSNSSSNGLSVINCVFTDNDVTQSGGAVFNNGATAASTFTNSVFYNNTAADVGGGVYNAAVSNFINCTFVKNATQTNGGGMFNDFNTTNVYNTVFFGNLATGSDPDMGGSQDISASSSNNASDGTGRNINTGTGFISLSSSPFSDVNDGDGVDDIWATEDDGVAIDAVSVIANNGDDAQNNETQDIAGNNRKKGTIDIGAYETTSFPCEIANRLYVDINASGNNSGESWANAFTDLQEAMDCATSGKEIWVAAGTYYPTESYNGNSTVLSDKAFHFTSNTDLKIYGGFAGTETSITQRVENNVSILSGDLGVLNDNSDNSFHVILTLNLTNASLLDGFTIQDGNADSTGTSATNLNRNDGGGMANYQSEIVVSNCVFKNNNAISEGGAIMNNSNANITVLNCVFTDNSAINTSTSSGSGGAVYNFASGGQYINTVFHNNTAKISGGATAYSTSGAGSQPDFINCTFTNNNSPTGNGGAIYIGFGSVAVQNSVFYGNTAASNNEIGGGTINSANSTNNAGETTINGINSGTGFVDLSSASAASVFVDLTDPDGADDIWATDDDGLSILSSSPLANGGDDTKNSETKDIKDETRKVGTIDIGAYEYYIQPCIAATRLYVNINASGDNTGETWSNAFTDLQEALDCADAGEEIWVAAGTYKPIDAPDGTSSTGSNDRNNAYHFTNKNLKIYGGFVGTETMLAQRDAKTNVTILSGDIGTVNDNSDNVYHILITKDLDNSTIIDGFTFEKGNGNGTGDITYDAGQIQRNNSGAMFNAASEPTISNCIFKDNNASDEGGAIVNALSGPIFLNCVFYNNSSDTRGGAIYNTAGIPTYTQCIFANNTAARGGALFNDFAQTNIINCIFSKNTATTSGAGIENDASSAPIIHNTVFYENKIGATVDDINGDNIDAISTNNASDGTGGNISAGANFVALTVSPFVDNSDPDGADNVWATADDGLFHEALVSTIIDAGDDTKNSETTDITGAARKQSTIDIGAYETIISPCIAATRLYVNAAAVGNNTGESWTNAFTDLQNALDCADAGEEIWIAAGTYKPTDAPDGTVSTGVNDPNNAFHFANKDLRIYGGFAGTETSFSQRNTTTNIVTLSGDLGTINDASDNAEHVMVIVGLTIASTLDGLVFRYGNATGTGTIDYVGETLIQNNAGGLYSLNSSPTIADCDFKDNSSDAFGGGMFNSGSTSTIENCEFSNNTATSDGGAMYNDFSDVFVENCVIKSNMAANSGGVHNNLSTASAFVNTVFSNNTATISGGAMSNFASTVSTTQCVFSNNTATSGNGGAVDNPANSTTNFYSCTFSNNTANTAGGFHNNLSMTTMYNTVFYGNTASGSVSDISGDNIDGNSSHNASDGTGANISAGTGFVSLTVSPFENDNDPDGADNTFATVDDGLASNDYSPLINAGNNNQNGKPSDITGATRKQSTIDIGAYERDVSPCVAATRLFVNHAASGNNTGESWANAFTDLQDALNCADAGEEIWVAGGTYYPTSAPDGSILDTKDKAFYLNKDLKIYGGFVGTETMLSERDFLVNVTILSGDFNDNDGTSGSGTSFAITNNSGNAYHVLISTGLTNAAIIDGFTIIGGNGTTAPASTLTYSGQAFDKKSGGGMSHMSSAPTLSNLIFSKNESSNGGGLFCNSDVVLDKVTFEQNIGTLSGGGMYVNGSAPGLTSVIFIENVSANSGGGLYLTNSTATLDKLAFSKNAAVLGGGLYSAQSSLTTLTNLVFSENTADNDGAGMYSITQSPKLTNTTFYGNIAGNDGGAIFLVTSSPTFVNTAFYKNEANSAIDDISGGTVNASSTHNASDGTGGNISTTGTDFVNLISSPFVAENDLDGVDNTWLTEDDGLVSASCLTPTILNKGTTPSPTVPNDILGNVRVNNYDIGAYEYQNDVTVPDASADIPSGDNSVTVSQDANTSYASDCSKLIAKVIQSGDNPITGSVDANVWIKGSVPTHNGKAYLQRHFQITPQNNPNTATGKVTLYFTQAELDAYNADLLVTNDLPTNPNDVAGKANLRITKFGGTSSDGTGNPSTYSGGIIVIDPDDDNIIWNADKSRWEVTFEVEGFSGFFVSNPENVLPVELTYFKGERTESGNLLTWQTATEDNNEGFEIQKSDNGVNWENIGFVGGNGYSAEPIDYSFLDGSTDFDINYYRLKQIDFDGKFEYSNVITIIKEGQEKLINIYPNPTRNNLTIENAVGTVAIFNALGQSMREVIIENDMYELNVSDLPLGTYHLQIRKLNGEIRTMPFVKL